MGAAGSQHSSDHGTDLVEMIWRGGGGGAWCVDGAGVGGGDAWVKCMKRQMEMRSATGA